MSFFTAIQVYNYDTPNLWTQLMKIKLKKKKKELKIVCGAREKQ